MDDMNESMSWTMGSRWYEQLKAVDDRYDLESRELKSLDVMNSSWLCMIWKILGCELKL